MIITKETDEYPEKSLNYFADRPWKGTYVKTLVGNTVEDFFEETDIEGLFYQLIDNRKGIRISHGSVDIDRIAEEISEYQKTMEENQMTLTNDGTLTIEKGYTEQFIKLLIDQI